MARKRKGIRVYGPYRYRGRWRIIVRDGSTGEKSYVRADSEAEAKTLYKQLVKEKAKVEAPGVAEAVLDYEKYLAGKGNKEQSVRCTMDRIERFFGDNDTPLPLLTRAQVQRIFGERCEEWAPDSIRNIFAEVRTFFKWCQATRRTTDNPTEGIDTTMAGRRRRGKPQLRPGEARKFLALALDEARQGNDGSLACALALLLGLRQSEITRRVVRDVDRFSKRLYIEQAKTEAGNRAVEVPEVLWPLLEARIRGREATAFLFPNSKGKPHRKEWLNRHCKRICNTLKLPVVPAHGLRGTHSSLAQSAGVTAHLVAQQLGHASETTTIKSYTAPGIRESQEQSKVMVVLEGGRP